MPKHYEGAQRIIVNTTNSQDGEFEIIDRDRVIPGVHIPSDKYKAGYDKIDWKKKEAAKEDADESASSERSPPEESRAISE